MTSNKDLATRFVDAVNTYIELQNEKRKRYGLADPLPRLDQLEAGAEDLLTQFSKHHFPDNSPHRHLYFFDEFKQNDEYIAFGGNANYNDVYVVEQASGKVLVFSEEEAFLHDCAASFAAFLEAFIILIALEVELGCIFRSVCPPPAYFNQNCEQLFAEPIAPPTNKPLRTHAQRLFVCSGD